MDNLNPFCLQTSTLFPHLKAEWIPEQKWIQTCIWHIIYNCFGFVSLLATKTFNGKQFKYCSTIKWERKVRMRCISWVKWKEENCNSMLLAADYSSPSPNCVYCQFYVNESDLKSKKTGNSNSHIKHLLQTSWQFFRNISIYIQSVWLCVTFGKHLKLNFLMSSGMNGVRVESQSLHHIVIACSNVLYNCLYWNMLILPEIKALEFILHLVPILPTIRIMVIINFSPLTTFDSQPVSKKNFVQQNRNYSNQV